MFLGLSSFRRQNAIFMTAKNMLDFKRQKSTHKREDTGHLKCVILKKIPRFCRKLNVNLLGNFSVQYQIRNALLIGYVNVPYYFKVEHL